MDAGLKVRLNPNGGNQLNFREALKLYLAPIEEPEELAEDEDYDEHGENEPRKNAQDDYDYEDDFIDDDEVFEDEVDDTPSNDKKGPSVVAEETPQGPNFIDQAPVHHGFGNFWVNKGNLPPKKDVVVPQPPSALGNVVLENVKLTPFMTSETVNRTALTNDTQPSQPTVRNNSAETAQKPGMAVSTPNPSDASKKANQTNSAPGANSSKTNQARLSQNKGKLLQANVLNEITKLAALCQKEFGDKKPKLSDPSLQEQLDVLFRAAMAAGVAKLFSDIAKEKRLVALSDELWNRLSFLRVKRATLEVLGHALIWSTKEKEAKSLVDKTEAELEGFMVERRRQAAIAKGIPSALIPVVFDDEVDNKIYEWYRAKSELQKSKNQLAVRVKSVKKCVGTWVASLKKAAFKGWSVAEGEIVEAFRRVEDMKIVAEKQRKELEKQQRELERQRKENERLEKKRKREELVAAAAAKRAATEKPPTGTGIPLAANATTTTGNTGHVSGSSTSSGVVVPPGVTVVKPRPKVPKASVKNGAQGGVKPSVKNAGMKKAANGEKAGMKIVKPIKKDGRSDSKGNLIKTSSGKNGGANGVKSTGVQRKTTSKGSVKRMSTGPVGTNGQAQGKVKDGGKGVVGKTIGVKTGSGKATCGKTGGTKITSTKTCEKGPGVKGTAELAASRAAAKGKKTSSKTRVGQGSDEKKEVNSGKNGLPESKDARQGGGGGEGETEVIELD